MWRVQWIHDFFSSPIDNSFLRSLCLFVVFIHCYVSFTFHHSFCLHFLQYPAVKEKCKRTRTILYLLSIKLRDEISFKFLSHLWLKNMILFLYKMEDCPIFSLTLFLYSLFTRYFLCLFVFFSYIYISSCLIFDSLHTAYQCACT